MSKKLRQASEKEIDVMLSQIEKNDNIAIFNAQKALYIYVDDQDLIGDIVSFLRYKKKKLGERNDG